MTHTRTKLTVAGVGLLIAVAYLAFAGVKQGWVYHVPVEQFLADKQHLDQRVRLAGKVSPVAMEVNGGQFSAKFTLVGPGVELPVAYRGVVPDMFKADGEVVVEGKLDQASGVFEADVLMTKCASKYESEAHAARDPRAKANTENHATGAASVAGAKE